MADQLNEASKKLRKTGDQTKLALQRDQRQPPYVERVRDVFDYEYAFEMEFHSLGLMSTKGEGTSQVSTLDLKFSLPPMNCCCTECFCAQCEYFLGTSDTTLTMSHNIVDATVSVFVNDVQTTNFSVTLPRTVNLGFTPSEADDVVYVCYTSEVELYGPTSCEDCETPAYTELANVPVNEDSSDIDWDGLITLTANQAPGGYTGYVAATWTTHTGHPTWAHTTTGGPGGEDTPVSTIPFVNLMAAVDDDPSSCASTGAPTIVMRTGAEDGGFSCAAANWIIGFPRPVKICGISGSLDGDDAPDSILGLGADGIIVPFDIDQINSGVESPTVWAIKITFVRCFTAGPFNLAGIIGPRLCDIQICASDANCRTFLQYQIGGPV